MGLFNKDIIELQNQEIAYLRGVLDKKSKEINVIKKKLKEQEKALSEERAFHEKHKEMLRLEVKNLELELKNTKTTSTNWHIREVIKPGWDAGLVIEEIQKNSDNSLTIIVR